MEGDGCALTTIIELKLDFPNTFRSEDGCIALFSNLGAVGILGIEKFRLPASDPEYLLSGTKVV